MSFKFQTSIYNFHRQFGQLRPISFNIPIFNSLVAYYFIHFQSPKRCVLLFMYVLCFWFVYVKCHRFICDYKSIAIHTLHTNTIIIQYILMQKIQQKGKGSTHILIPHRASPYTDRIHSVCMGHLEIPLLLHEVVHKLLLF